MQSELTAVILFLMAAWSYLIICILTGYFLILNLIPRFFHVGERDYRGRYIGIPSFMAVLPLSITAGVVFVSWPSYFLAYFLRDSEDGLKLADIICVILCATFIVVCIFMEKGSNIKRFKALFKGTSFMDVLALALSFAVGIPLMWSAFSYKEGRWHVGLSAFGDFSTHLDMIRSFAYGNNFPTSYSHFAGADLKYHFMNQFFSGNLEHLGMRLDHAFNISALMFFVSMCMLLYVLAGKFTGRKGGAFLALMFILFRSSPTFYDFVMQNYDAGIAENLKANTTFLGKTVNENWGLYNLNVYTNQRHLALGFSAMLAAIIAYADNIYFFDGKEKAGIRGFLFSKDAWLVKDLKKAIAFGLLLGLCSFFNGAAVIAALIVLFFMALGSSKRLEYLITAVLTLLCSSGEAKFFIDGSAMNFRFEPGYLAEYKNIFGMVHFLVTLFGIALVLFLTEFVLAKKLDRWMMVCFAAPLMFAFTFQMTTDGNVNHKYVMASMVLCAVAIAGLLARMFSKKGLVMKAAALFCTVIMVLGGIYDFECVLKQNDAEINGEFSFAADDPVTEWVIENSDAEDIFLTDIYSISSLTMGGAMLYYGWPYYAWSAGYDTIAREEKAKAMYSASDPKALTDMVRENNIRFIVVDDALRHEVMFKDLNEDNIKATFKCVYEYNDIQIYDTYLVL